MKRMSMALFAVVFALTTFGQEVPPMPTRPTPAPPPGRTESNEMMKASQAENTMIEHNGTLYMVSGARLVKMDIETLEPLTCCNLAKLKVNIEADESEKKYKAEYLAAYDVDKDGVLTGREVSRAPQLRRMDKNNDGKVTVDEIDAPKDSAPGERGPVVLLVSGDKLIMLRTGYVFKFDLNTLELLQYKKVGIRAKDVTGGKCTCAGEAAPADAQGETKKPEEPKKETIPAPEAVAPGANQY